MASKELKTKPETDIYQLFAFKNEHLIEENYEIENNNDQMDGEEMSGPERRRQELLEEINEEEREEQFFLDFMHSDKVIDAEEVCFIEFEVNNMQAFLLDSTAYVADKLQRPNKEVNFQKLSPHHQELIKEAVAKEVFEVLRSHSLFVDSRSTSKR